MKETLEIVDKLQSLPTLLRTTPMNVKDIIPIIQEAADEIEKLLKIIEQEFNIKAARSARGKMWSPDRR